MALDKRKTPFLVALAATSCLIGGTAVAQTTAPAQAEQSQSIEDTSPEPAQNSSDTDASTTEPGIRADPEAAADAPDTATAKEGACQAEIDRLAKAGAEASGKLDELRKDMDQAAISQPLLVSLADGSFVYLGDQGGMAEPLGSWFTAQDMVQQAAKLSEQASKYQAEKDEAECLKMMQSAGQ